MEQLSLFDTVEITALRGQEILDAWHWLLENLSPRPSQDSGLCVYDLKLWGNDATQQPLEPRVCITCKLGYLYLASELADMQVILCLVNGGTAQDVVMPAGSLDANVEKVVRSRRRFRTALSEHLAFWVRLATAAQSKADDCRFMCSLPNVRPETQGPDGLFFITGPVSQVEIQSVKNTIGDPQSLISCKGFRLKGQTTAEKKGKLLEDFYSFAHQNLGFVELDRLLSKLSKLLDVSSDRKIRIGLLSNTTCSYNAVVLADIRFAKIGLFQGYQFVTGNTKRRIATYIGSTEWAKVAEQARHFVRQRLKRVGLV